MICSNCKTNWSVRAGNALGNCPGCGADALDMLNNQLSYPAIEAILQNMLIVHGNDLLNNKLGLSALICSLFHNDNRVMRLLLLSIQNEIPRKLHTLCFSQSIELTMQISSLRLQFKQLTLLKEERINEIFQYWTLAFNPKKLLSTEANKEDGEWIDEYGVKYSSDHRKLKLAPIHNVSSYCPINGTEVICDYSFWENSTLLSVTFPPSVFLIGNYAFYKCTSLIKVVLPDSVKYIGQRVFSGCGSLGKIIIPSSVKSIGNGAFSSCLGLSSFEIPASVDYIMGSPFRLCENLLSIDVDKASQKFSSINGVLFDNSVSKIICFPGGKAKLEQVYSIPSSVTTIGESAFEGCGGLISINIASSVTIIGENAFCFCDSLQSILIPSSVFSIGDRAFWFCSSLTELIIPPSVVSIGVEAFLGCEGLTCIFLPDSIKEIGKGVFNWCKNLKQIIISPNNYYLRERLEQLGYYSQIVEF